VKGLSSECELLEFARDPDDSAWYYSSLAISGTPCVRFSLGADTVANMACEEALGEYLERQARTLIERYGDRRNPRPEAFAEYLEA